MTFILLIAVFAIVITLGVQNDRIRKLERAIQGKDLSLVPVPPPRQAGARPLSPSDIQAIAAAVDAPLRPAASSVPLAPKQKEHDEASSGRVLGAIGIAAVFIGVAFFLKYAFDNDWISPVGRVMIGVASGLLLLGLGQYLRKKYLEYSDLLMGGGIALLYLSFFSAHFFYHLVSPLTAWLCMALVTAFAFVISIVNATQTLAFVAVIGGFLTPFLARSGGNDMAALFSYLSLLNVGVLALAFFKKWPGMILAALVGTVVNFVSWAAAHYVSDALAPTLSFSIFTFLVFLGASIARPIKAKAIADPLDYVTIGGNAAFIAVTGYLLLAPAHEDVLGLAAVLVAALYVIASLVVNHASREDRALNIFLPGLAVTFLSVAVPLQFDGAWIAVAWLVESVFLYAVASSIGNRGFQVMGAVTYILGLIAFFSSDIASWGSHGATPLFNKDFGVLALAIVAAYAIAYVYRRYGSVTPAVQKNGVEGFTAVGSALALLAVPHEFSGIWVVLGWIVEACVFYGVSATVSSRPFQIAGAVAYALGLFQFFLVHRPYGGAPSFVPIFNVDFLVLVFAALSAYGIAFLYKRFGSSTLGIQSRGLSLFVIAANILTIYAISSQIVFYYDTIGTASAQNYSNTLVSIFWAVYAAGLTAIGFIRRIAGIRRFGLVLFIVTAFKVVIDVWSLGQIYRIVSLIVFGAIALAASFAYAKYKDRLKEVI